MGIKDKFDGYDTLMGLRDLKPFKYEDDETHYGKVNDIKFKYHNYSPEHITINIEVWISIGDSFNLSYEEVQELTMWAIGSEPNFEGVFTITYDFS